MKEGPEMPNLHRFILHPLTTRIFLGALGVAYLVYLVGFVHALTAPSTAPSATVVEHAVDMAPSAVLQYWTPASMQASINADQQVDQSTSTTQENVAPSAGKAARQEGQLPRDQSLTYPLSTVGKLFFTSASGQNMSCSGTALVSQNQSVVDTAGHCLYWQGGWVQNVIFCPLYENGSTPYGCWAARDLEVPSDWINRKLTEFHHDMGMAIVAPNNEGALTEVVGGAGWAYNQPANQTFYAYGYPAGYPYDGQTRQSCENSQGKTWQLFGGTVISIPCGMTGGSSGGPWFIQIDGTWYLNGHNDFTSSLQYGHMFSPYYDDTWYTLYTKAQQS
jgi:hypothetical protein